ncbi:uncharacterized protein LOC143845518 [Tasmannia lanceolata]|uniref:uncharacterized protein LOC143845518 n=1 Tax=Tasmannia lanceolata TaxID=3420 RepID=UPI004062EA53
MNSSAFSPHFYFPGQSTNTIPTPKSPHILSITTRSYPKYPSIPSPTSTQEQNTTHPKPGLRPYVKKWPSAKLPILESTPNAKISPKEEFSEDFPSGFSRLVLFGAASVGLAMFVLVIDDQKALALGPEGPLMEEFWDNMRRYGLYILTVSSGVIYTILQPILELLKNPISAILIITILGGSIFVLSQVLSAMVGISEFSYDYGY